MTYRHNYTPILHAPKDKSMNHAKQRTLISTDSDILYVHSHLPNNFIHYNFIISTYMPQQFSPFFFKTDIASNYISDFLHAFDSLHYLFQLSTGASFCLAASLK